MSVLIIRNLGWPLPRALTEAERAYMAALIDGEGAVSIYRVRPPRTYRQPGRYKGRAPRAVRHYMKICIVNGSPELIGWLRFKLGGTVSVRRPRTKRHRQTWLWTLMQQRAGELLVVVRPYLIAKTKQADLAIEFMAGFVDSRGGGISGEEAARREDLCSRIQDLNRRPGAEATVGLVPVVPGVLADGLRGDNHRNALAETPATYAA